MRDKIRQQRQELSDNMYQERQAWLMNPDQQRQQAADKPKNTTARPKTTGGLGRTGEVKEQQPEDECRRKRVKRDEAKVERLDKSLPEDKGLSGITQLSSSSSHSESEETQDEGRRKRVKPDGVKVERVDKDLPETARLSMSASHTVANLKDESRTEQVKRDDVKVKQVDNDLPEMAKLLLCPNHTIVEMTQNMQRRLNFNPTSDKTQ
ncbi:hypothetical protein BGX29_001103 [Mortierella sp. GBA35]|nr:hypothetical protein BGX29_001103 [Mortierella sp. GBA35]